MLSLLTSINETAALVKSTKHSSSISYFYCANNSTFRWLLTMAKAFGQQWQENETGIILPVAVLVLVVIVAAAAAVSA